MSDPEAPVQSNPGSGGTGETPTTPVTPAPAGATQEGAEAWRNMVPQEFRDHTALKDYKDFGGFVKSHVHLTELLGRDMRVPAQDADPDVWNRFYDAVGRPERHDAYNLPVPEGEDAPQIVPEILDGFRKTAHSAGLSASQASKIAEWYFNALSEQADGQAADGAAELERVERQLKREYGKAYDNNIRIGMKVAEDFGGPEFMEFLDSSGLGNNPLIIKTFVKIARSMSEDRLGSSRGSDFGYSPAEAHAEIGRLNMDTDFQKALHDKDHPGHGAAVERKRQLFEAAYPTEDAG